MKYLLLVSIVFCFSCMLPRPPVAGDPSGMISQDLWERCGGPVERTVCGGGNESLIYTTTCMRQKAKRYFALRSLPEKRDFLIRNGCPEAMVMR